MIVYLLNDYGEHGPESLMATTDRRTIRGLIEALPLGPGADEWKAEALAGLEKALSKYPEGAEFSANLHKGWGGLQLHAVRLQP